MKELKQEYLRIARELQYPKSVRQEIKLAKSETEITKIMLNARLSYL